MQYIAEKILKINEWKRWSDPPPADPAKRALQDEEIFQVAKLVKYVKRLFYAESLPYQFIVQLRPFHELYNGRLRSRIPWVFGGL